MSMDKNVLHLGDNLEVMKSLPDESVDLIYCDPPFNTGRDFVEFDDRWDSLSGYLDFMIPRLHEIHRLLKLTGSFYLHCDPTASHYLKVETDKVFNINQFRNEIVWRIGWISGNKTQKKGWIRNHDIILYYTKTDSAINLFNKKYIPYPEDYTRRDGNKPTGYGIAIEDTWNCSKNDILDSIQIKSFSTEKVGYPTQKPLALLDRIIQVSSNLLDVVLDPFCGSGTTLVSANQLGRYYIGIDNNMKAIEISEGRLQQQNLFTMNERKQ